MGMNRQRAVLYLSIKRSCPPLGRRPANFFAVLKVRVDVLTLTDNGYYFIMIINFALLL
jgi:hypothetical protein